MNFTGKNSFSKFLDKKTTVGSSTINLFCPCLVLHFSFYEPVVYPGNFWVVELWLVIPAAIPMPWVGALLTRGNQPLPASVSETRFLASPHLTVFLHSHEHMLEVLRGERVVTIPPTAFSLSTMAVLGKP